jgi:hypothetical protein
MKIILSVLVFAFTSAALAATPTDGKYHVPVPAQIAEYASYDIRVRTNDPSNPTQISYVLPLELTGQRNLIRLTKQTEDGRKWTGPHADASCGTNNSMIECSVKYKNLTFDSAKAESLIRSKFTAEEEIQGRLAAAKFFGGEPAGVVSFPLR